MATSREFAAFVEDLFSEFGRVVVRPMFGGSGVFHAGAMVGLIADDTLYLRTDEDLAAELETLGSTPFVYGGKARTVAMPYWRVPESLLDDPSEFAGWASRAARVAEAAKKKKGRGR